jgi:hypothetical protein
MVLSRRRICFQVPQSRGSWLSAFLCSGPVVVLRGGHDLQAGIPLLHGRGTHSPTSLLVRGLHFFLSPHYFAVCFRGLVSLGLQEVFTIVFVFPRILLQYALGARLLLASKK